MAKIAAQMATLITVTTRQ